MTVTGKTGTAYRTYRLDPVPIGSGGEGDVYSVVGMDKVAKIYRDGALTKELEEKLRIMIEHPPSESVLTQVAWPLDIVYDGDKCLGFIMPKLNINAELGEIYKYPSALPLSAHQKINIAQNICVVISEVHKAGYVFGDFNPRNIGLDKDTGLVSFLDTDTYHVFNGSVGAVYRCNVCAPGYAAPELLEKCSDYVAENPTASKSAYAETPLPTFTRETDNFALAIHIFKLLMNGYTPFGGIIETASVSQSSPGVGDSAVRRDSYCFKPGYKHQSAAIMPLDALPQEIADLFTRAFIIGKHDPKQRPDAAEWHNALTKYEQSLVTCRNNPLHQYDRKNVACPLCEADTRYAAAVGGTVSPAQDLKQSTYTPPPELVANLGTQTTPQTVSAAPAQTNMNKKRPNGTKAALIAAIPLLIVAAAIIIAIQSSRNTPVNNQAQQHAGNASGQSIAEPAQSPAPIPKSPSVSESTTSHTPQPASEPTPNQAPTPTPSPSPSPTPTPTPSPSPTPTPTPSPSPSPTPKPPSVYTAYYDIMTSAIIEYGIVGVDGAWSGVYNAQLIDFDNDGLPELVFTTAHYGESLEWFVYGYSDAPHLLFNRNEGGDIGGTWGSIHSGKNNKTYLYFSTFGDWSESRGMDRNEYFYAVDNGKWITALTRTYTLDASLDQVYEWTVDGLPVNEQEYNTAPYSQLGVVGERWNEFIDNDWRDMKSDPARIYALINELL